MSKSDQLVGRSFVALSNNVCRLHKIGPDGIRVQWHRKPTQADIDEFTRWCEGIIGEFNATVNMGREGEAAAYSEWKRKQGHK